MSSLLHDLRYGFRLLAKMPGFAAIATLTLAIGIGANTAIFSVVEAVLLKPLAMHDPGRVLLVQEVWKGVGGGGLSVGNFADIRQQNSSFAKITALGSASFNLATADAPERITGGIVASDFFETFGVAPIRGRVFSPEENQHEHKHVVVLSERLWRTRFDSDPGLVGRPLHINGEPYTVVGIMPASFDPLLDQSLLWVPAGFQQAQLADHDNHYLLTFARLKPGTTIEQARAELDVIAARERQRFPLDDKERSFSLTPLTDILLGDQRLAMFTMLGAVGFVLLIACANIANLQLARARARRKEIAVRVAMGASPSRIVRQLLAESAALSACGALAGVLLAYWGVAWLVANAPSGVPRIEQSRVDGAALLFACGAALFSSLIFGMAPALRSAAVRIAEAFNEGSSRAGSSRDWVRSALVIGEVALALTLLVGAGLLIRSSLAVSKVDPGFDTSNLVVGRVGLSDPQYHDPAVARRTFEAILAQVRQLPAVQNAAVVSRAPMTSGNNSNGLLAEGKPLDPSNLVDAQLRVVSPGYVSMVRIPLKGGREFTPQDTREHPLVVLVNETLARKMWPGESAIGKRFACCEFGPKGRLDPVWHEVVGVVSDTRAWGLDQEVRPEFYMPMEQMPPNAWDWIGRSMDLVVRTHGGTLPLNELRSTVASVAPGLPIYGVSTMQQKISSRLEESHFDTFLLAVFASTALLLASIGVYGVLSYMVAQRTREIGIRMALGATRATVVRSVLVQGIRLTGAGLVAGIVGALLTSRLVATLLFGVRPTDAITFCVVSLLLAAVAAFASYWPARRASRIDPMVALRNE